VILVLAVLVVGMATPSVATSVVAKAKNADKVDGLHAVKSTASLKKRSGKLVATDKRTGLLPNDIIGKAPDSDLLDGLDSTALVQSSTVRHDQAQCPGVTFVPFASSTLYSTSPDGRYTTGGIPVLYCGLALPVGAVVRRVTFVVVDADAVNDVVCQLVRQAQAGPTGSIASNLMASVSSSGAPTGTNITTTLVGTPVIDAAHNYYAACTLGASSNLQIVGSYIDYDVSVTGAPIS